MRHNLTNQTIVHRLCLPLLCFFGICVLLKANGFLWLLNLRAFNFLSIPNGKTNIFQDSAIYNLTTISYSKFCGGRGVNAWSLENVKMFLAQTPLCLVVFCLGFFNLVFHSKCHWLSHNSRNACRYFVKLCFVFEMKTSA